MVGHLSRTWLLRFYLRILLWQRELWQGGELSSGAASPPWACLSLSEQWRGWWLFCFLTGCWNGKWDDCWGRPLPGITCVLSARNYYSCRGTVIHHSLKESPHSSRRGFSESVTNHTAEFLNPTARDIFHRCKDRSAPASSPQEA